MLSVAVKNIRPGISLAIQWLGLGTFTAEGLGSIPGGGTKISQAMWSSKKKKEKKNQAPS